MGRNWQQRYTSQTLHPCMSPNEYISMNKIAQIKKDLAKKELANTINQHLKSVEKLLPVVMINNTILSTAQSLVLHNAINAFAMDLKLNGLGKNEMGLAMVDTYLRIINEIEEVFAKETIKLNR